jgi:hypothetical protein
MRSSRTKNFRKLFKELPQRVKEIAKKNYELWKENPFHPSIEFKEVKPKENLVSQNRNWMEGFRSNEIGRRKNSLVLDGIARRV